MKNWNYRVPDEDPPVDDDDDIQAPPE